MGICASTSVNEKEALEQFNNADVQHHGTLDHDIKNYKNNLFFQSPYRAIDLGSTHVNI